MPPLKDAALIERVLRSNVQDYVNYNPCVTEEAAIGDEQSHDECGSVLQKAYTVSPTRHIELMKGEAEFVDVATLRDILLNAYDGRQSFPSNEPRGPGLVLLFACNTYGMAKTLARTFRNTSFIGWEKEVEDTISNAFSIGVFECLRRIPEDERVALSHEFEFHRKLFDAGIERVSPSNLTPCRPFLWNAQHEHVTP